MNIEITDAAVKQVKSLMESGKIAAHTLLRLGVKGGGCSGFSYVVDFTEAQQDDDHVLDRDGIRVVVDPRSYPLLEGSVVDYKKTLMSQGFVFDNPRAKSACGCGTSFDV